MPVVMNVVGARPQFIKAGPVSLALARAGATELLVHTGQHYDDLMSDAVMADVGLRPADFNLGVGSGSHGAQTARMLEGIEGLIIEHNPESAALAGTHWLASLPPAHAYRITAWGGRGSQVADFTQLPQTNLLVELA